MKNFLSNRTLLGYLMKPSFNSFCPVIMRSFGSTFFETDMWDEMNRLKRFLSGINSDDKYALARGIKSMGFD